MTRPLLVALAALVLAPAASAQLAVDADMVLVSGEQTVRATASGHTVVAAPSTGMIVDRADETLSGSIDCSGHGALSAEGAPRTYSSVCIVADASGDVYTVAVEMDPSEPSRSTWRMLSGTGRYADATGSGLAHRLARTADGRQAFHVTGTLQNVQVAN